VWNLALEKKDYCKMAAECGMEPPSCGRPTPHFLDRGKRPRHDTMAGVTDVASDRADNPGAGGGGQVTTGETDPNTEELNAYERNKGALFTACGHPNHIASKCFLRTSKWGNQSDVPYKDSRACKAMGKAYKGALQGCDRIPSLKQLETWQGDKPARYGEVVKDDFKYGESPMLHILTRFSEDYQE